LGDGGGGELGLVGRGVLGGEEGTSSNGYDFSLTSRTAYSELPSWSPR